MASNWRIAMEPLVSVSSTWSTSSPISSPAIGLPETRWRSISLRARLRPMPASPLVDGRERSARGALVVRAGPDQAVVVVLLEQVRSPARDAARRDHRREEIHRDADRVEERRRVEVDVGDELLHALHARVERDRNVVPEPLAGFPARGLG